jgi:membrane protein implicated in regulation of membrane protease activity
LAGLACRGRYGPLRLSLWLIAALLVVWVVLIAPFFVIAMIASSGNAPVADLMGAVLCTTGISFGLLLPFLLLSFANPFYRERLKGLLHLGRESLPPVIAPTMPAAPAAAGG